MSFEQIVKVPYTTLPRMEKYEGDLFKNPPSEIHLAEKRRELVWDDGYLKNIYPNYGISFASDMAVAQKLVKRVSDIFQFEPVYDIVKLGLKIQEDIVLLYNGKIEAAFVAFPSGWNPLSAWGKTLEQLHGPVADGDVLRKMSNRITQLMCGEYCYHRWIWTLTNRKYLSAHPVYTKNKPNPQKIEDLWWRTEHQITFPIQKGISSGFLIDVNMTPYTFLSQNQQSIIRESINTMSESVLKYKRLEEIKKLINNV